MRIEATSEPAPGSVTPTAVMVVPAITPGRYFSSWRLVPKRIRCGLAMSVWTSTVMAKPPWVERPTSSASTTDARALQTADGSSRIAACWYTPTAFTTSSFSVGVDLSDGQVHDLELYFVDWDSTSRAEQVQISDASTGAVLSTQSVSAFQSGVYLDYVVSGHIVITITLTAGANAVLSGLFLDPLSTATFDRQDTATQGTWIGTYGATGYDIVAGPASLPSGDTITPTGQSTYTWTTASTDPRALQVPGTTNRVAAVWYSPTSFTVSVNFGDGLAQHDLELYLLDWDNKRRAETVQITDAASGTVLSTQTISSFQSGEYEGIDRVADPSGVAHLRRLRFHDRAERPMVVELRPLCDPAPQRLDLLRGERVSARRRRRG